MQALNQSLRKKSSKIIKWYKKSQYLTQCANLLVEQKQNNMESQYFIREKADNKDKRDICNILIKSHH